jgi:hypothetical protein
MNFACVPDSLRIEFAFYVVKEYRGLKIWPAGLGIGKEPSVDRLIQKDKIIALQNAAKLYRFLSSIGEEPALQCI